ncbi:EH signature domain-containing protein [Hoeflea poritis]|uniref:EH signature domain-containing protein n=1 Tax=Hoeflea poritis TaxID=2993659 RepID=A0ABT4VQF2_9HYPH|nr:EH signature domain-containing protein [Hoeflea poritis]MDA4846248.1 EH signature domain-containing protein [Hoeflea poritis]
MSTLETLVAFGNPRPKRISKPVRLDRIYNAIKMKVPDFVHRSDEDLSAIARAYSRRLETNDWDGATEGDISTLIRAAVSDRLKQHPSLVEFLFSEAAVTSRGQLLAALCEGYLESWIAESRNTILAAEIIAKRLEDLPEQFLNLFMSCPEIGDAIRGAGRFAERMKQQQDAYAWCVSQGLPNPHGTGFCAKSQSAYFRLLPLAETREHITTLMRWITPNNGRKLQGDALLEGLRLLLDPWLRRDPSDDIKRLLVDWMIDHFGDPRIEAPEVWNRMAETHTAVLMRWLAGDSIRAFMDVISDVENRETWKVRRTFWTSLFEDGIVEEAWVALHPAAEAVALKRAQVTGDVSYRSFAKQSGSRTDTSLLIMRSGERVIVEGSHNYRVHIFDKGFPARPKLYEPIYLDQDITLPREDKRNTNWHDPPGHWRNWVRRRLQS